VGYQSTLKLPSQRIGVSTGTEELCLQDAEGSALAADRGDTQSSRVWRPVLCRDRPLLDGGIEPRDRLQINAFPFWASSRKWGPEITDSTGEGWVLVPILGVENARLARRDVGELLVCSPVITETVAVRLSFHVSRARRGYLASFGTVGPGGPWRLAGLSAVAPGQGRSMRV
jgi:hypothetical protein